MSSVIPIRKFIHSSNLSDGSTEERGVVENHGFFTQTRFKIRYF